MQIGGTPVFGHAQSAQKPQQQAVHFGLNDTGTLLLERPDTLEIGKNGLVLPKTKEDPQAKLYKELKNEMFHNVRYHTWLYLQAAPEMAPLIEKRTISPDAALQAVPEDRQKWVEDFFTRIDHYYLEPAREQVNKGVLDFAKKELPNHSEKELKKLLDGQDIEVARNERIPRARIRQRQKDSMETLDQVTKDAMLAGLREMQEWLTTNSPEIAAKEMEERYNVTSSKYNPLFAYV